MSIFISFRRRTHFLNMKSFVICFNFICCIIAVLCPMIGVVLDRQPCFFICLSLFWRVLCKFQRITLLLVIHPCDMFYLKSSRGIMTCSFGIAAIFCMWWGWLHICYDTLNIEGISVFSLHNVIWERPSFQISWMFCWHLNKPSQFFVYLHLNLISSAKVLSVPTL